MSGHGPWHQSCASFYGEAPAAWDALEDERRLQRRRARVAELEGEVAELEDELENLRAELERLRQSVMTP